MPASHTLVLADYSGPLIGALLFVLVMSRVPEPARRNFNAILVAGTCGAYLGGGFGIWELAYPLLATPVVCAGLRSYRFIGIAWLMHAAWDLAHHFWGNPIWPFMPTSSWGCMIFDAVVAIWFLAGAPALIQHIWPWAFGHILSSNQSGSHSRVRRRPWAGLERGLQRDGDFEKRWPATLGTPLDET